MSWLVYGRIMVATEVSDEILERETDLQHHYYSATGSSCSHDELHTDASVYSVIGSSRGLT